MIIGHKKQWQLLVKSKELGKIPHAFLFSGESQIGKRKIAFELAKLLLCRDIEKKSHPDFIFLKSDKIQVSHIRELIWKLSLKPYESDYKIAVIDEAHLMDKEAQNCLLKTLEEPKGDSFLILITEYPEALFPTIVSRTQKVKFFPVKKEEIKNYLVANGIKEDKAEYFSVLSSGRPGRAIEFSLNEEKTKEQEKVISDLKKISGSDLAFRFQYIKNLLGEKNGYSILSFKEILDIWLDYFRNLMFLKIDNKDSLLKIKKTISFIQNINYLVSTTNANSKIALEILLMEIQYDYV